MIKLIYSIILVILCSPVFTLKVWAVSCHSLPIAISAYLSEHLVFNKMNNILITRTTEIFRHILDPQNLILENSDDVAFYHEIERALQQINVVPYDCGPIERAVNLFKASIEKIASNKRSLNVTGVLHIKSLLHQYGFTETEIASEIMLLKDSLQHWIGHTSKEEFYDLFLYSFAHALDPHSNFEFCTRTPEDEGLGLKWKRIGLYPTVVQVHPAINKILDGKIHVGDRLISIKKSVNETNILNINTDQATPHHIQQALILKPDEKLLIQIQRLGKSTLINASIEYIEIHNKDITLNIRELSGFNIATIEILEFKQRQDASLSTADKIEQLLQEEMKKTKTSAVVLDLSNCSGGFIDEAVRTAGLFLKKVNVLRYRTRYGLDEIIQSPEPKSNQIFYDGPLVVLISQRTMSSAEVLAGTLKTYGRALIVGKCTFGKGTGTEICNIKEPELTCRIRTTTVQTHLPSGASFQCKGIEPHILIQNEATVTSPLKNEANEPNRIEPAPNDSNFLSNLTDIGAFKFWDRISEKHIQSLLGATTLDNIITCFLRASTQKD